MDGPLSKFESVSGHTYPGEDEYEWAGEAAAVLTAATESTRLLAELSAPWWPISATP